MNMTNTNNIINFIQSHNNARGELVSALNSIKEGNRPFKMEVWVGKQQKHCFKSYMTSVSHNPRIAFTMQDNDNAYVCFVSDEGVACLTPTLLHIPLWDGAISDLSVDYGYKVGVNFSYKSKVNHVDYVVDIRFDN